jgi:hypothetical protein
MSDRPNIRAKRLAVKRKAKDALASLRPLVRVLAELDRLQDAAEDAIGYVRIAAGDVEADYAADVLDIVAQARREAGRSRVVEVFVISTTDTHTADLADRSSDTCHEQDSTPTSEPQSARAARSSSESRRITRRV